MRVELLLELYDTVTVTTGTIDETPGTIETFHTVTRYKTKKMLGRKLTPKSKARNCK